MKGKSKMISQSEETTLPISKANMWVRAFKNLFQREVQGLLSSFRWLMKGLVYALLINFPLVITLQAASATPMAPEDRAGWVLGSGVSVFYWGVIICSIIAAIANGQSRLFSETESAFTAWLFSMPVPYSAYILSKLGTSFVDILLTVFIIPGLIAYGLLTGYIDQWPNFLYFSAGIGLLSLYVFFYFSLILLLNLLLQRRSLIIGILAVFTVSQTYLFSWFDWLAAIAPWGLLYIAIDFHSEAERSAILPIVTTISLSMLLLGTTLWRFRQAEFQ